MLVSSGSSGLGAGVPWVMGGPLSCGGGSGGRLVNICGMNVLVVCWCDACGVLSHYGRYGREQLLLLDSLA